LARYQLKISYDGTHYSGWQIQPNAPSVQETIEEAFFKLISETVRVVGSGRTDAGAHALGQIAHVDFETPFAQENLARALNHLLPKDIRILEAKPCSIDFHAQYSAKRKIYHYHLWTEKFVHPFVRLYRYHVAMPLNLEEIHKAKEHFIGVHDFTTFANVGSGIKNHTRHLMRIDIVPQEGGLRFEFEGEGFLYKMVRNIMGALIEVGLGHLTPDEIPGLLDAKDRRHAGRACPAHALFLMEVNYTDSNDGKCEKEVPNCSETLALSSSDRASPTKCA
jgi:tRNA pseudouridine38-40 synthase